MPDRERIERRLEALWEIALGPEGGADRPAYSPAEAEAMLLVAGWASEQGLEPGVDRYGNLWALPPDWSGPIVTSGSHVDTVPDGGRYDGALGTVLGLELVADLGAEPTPAGARAALMVCAAEEAPRFGAGTVGSRQLVGTLSTEALATLHDADGVTIAQALHDHLQRLAELPRIDPPVGRWRAHAEVHVAQRRELRELGVVTTVASPRRLEITVTGESGHAGEVSMVERRDALAGAAEIVLAIERAAREEPAGTVATAGTLTVTPGAISVDPRPGTHRCRHAWHRRILARPPAADHRAGRRRDRAPSKRVGADGADPIRRAGRARPGDGLSGAGGGRSAGHPGAHHMVGRWSRCPAFERAHAGAAGVRTAARR